MTTAFEAMIVWLPLVLVSIPFDIGIRDVLLTRL